MPRTATLYGSGRERRTGSGVIRPLLGGNVALDFINSISAHHDVAAEDDLSPGYTNLLGWSIAAGACDDEMRARLARNAQRDPREAASVRRRAVELRTAIGGIVTALIGEPEPDAADLAILLREVKHAQKNRTLAPGDGRLIQVWNDAPELDRVLWPISLAALELLTEGEIDRIRQCQAPECERLFLDTSRNGSRRYCSASGCGTVERVRRFRSRQQGPAQ